MGLAMADLTGIYPVAVGTMDLPVIAAVGVSVAVLAEATDRCADACVILGASAKLRGSDDASEPVIVGLTSRLRARLVCDFDENYANGKALDREGAIARIDPGLLSLTLGDA